MGVVPLNITATRAEGRKGESITAVAYIDSSNSINFLLSTGEPVNFRRGDPITIQKGDDTVVPKATRVAMVHFHHMDHKVTQPSIFSDQIRLYYVDKNSKRIEELCLNANFNTGVFPEQGGWFLGQAGADIKELLKGYAVHENSPFDAAVQRGVVRLFFLKATNAETLSMATSTPGGNWRCTDVFKGFA